MEKLSDWDGQKRLWGGIQIPSERVKQKILHIGIPNNTMTAEQLEAFEKLGKHAQELGIKIKVTAIQ